MFLDGEVVDGLCWFVRGSAGKLSPTLRLFTRFCFICVLRIRLSQTPRIDAVDVLSARVCVRDMSTLSLARKIVWLAAHTRRMENSAFSGVSRLEVEQKQTLMFAGLPQKFRVTNYLNLPPEG